MFSENFRVLVFSPFSFSADIQTRGSLTRLFFDSSKKMKARFSLFRFKSGGLGGWRSSKPGAFCRWRILRPCHERSLFWWWRWIRCWWVCSLHEILERPCLVWGPRPQRFWRDAGFTQVWQLILFCEKLLICLEGKSMTPSSRKRFSLLFIPSTLSSPSWTLEGLFELTHGTLQGPSTRLVRCLRNFRETRTPSGVPH